MKRFFPLFLFLCCTACVTQNKKPFLVGVSQCSEDAWREAANAELRREASFFDDIELDIRSVADDSERQIEDVEYFINQKVDLLVISPNEAEALTPVISKAFRMGIPVILYDRKIDSDEYTAYVGADNIQIGFQIGEYLKKTFPGDKPAHLLIARGTKGSTADRERYDGLMMSLNSDSQDKWDIVYDFYGNFLEEDAYQQTLSYLSDRSSDQTIDAVVAFNDRMAAGVYDALVDGDYHGFIPAILGVDAMFGPGGGVERILNGTLTASFIYPTGGEVVIDVARRILNRISYQKTNLLGTAAIDILNARVLQLQVNQLNEQQAKSERLNEQLKSNLAQYAGAKRLTIILWSLVLLSFMLLFSLYVSNRKLNHRNKLIGNQLLELENQKKKLEQLTTELEEATQAKLTFFTNVSHEFKTPLTLIAGTLDEMLSAPDISAKTRNTLQIANRNCNKLSALITEILDFRTLESGKMTLHKEPCEVKAFLEDLNQMFREIIRQRRLSFHFDCPDSAIWTMMDKNKLEKIYFNLLSNAFKHVDTNGSVQVSLTQYKADESLVLSVFNSGSYIPEDQVKSIFERFYKLGTDSASTGIGLAMTSSFVEMMGGVIQVESHPDKGTRFIVELPIIPVETVPAEVEDEYNMAYARMHLSGMGKPATNADILDDIQQGDQPTVLVIEDNLDMLQYIKNLLVPDYRVLLAQNGEIGLEKARKFLPQIIICDIMMPGMDGYQVCQALKQKELTEHIPIILLTACSQDEQKARGYESGADAFIQKPFNPHLLNVRISTLLEKDRRIRETFSDDWLLDRHPDSPSEGTKLVSNFKSYVEEHIDEEINVESLTRFFGMSKATLYRRLKEVTDYSPVDLIHLIRCRHALSLIQYKGMDISQAAFKSGYNSSSYFSRTFLKYYKSSPREWLKNNSD